MARSTSNDTLDLSGVQDEAARAAEAMLKSLAEEHLRLDAPKVEALWKAAEAATHIAVKLAELAE